MAGFSIGFVPVYVGGILCANAAIMDGGFGRWQRNNLGTVT